MLLTKFDSPLCYESKFSSVKAIAVFVKDYSSHVVPFESLGSLRSGSIYTAFTIKAFPRRIFMLDVFQESFRGLC